MGTAAEHASSDAIGYSGTRVAKIVGISYRQLDYWARTGLIQPSLSPAAGSGSRRAYSYRDLLELRVVKSLLDAGVKLESVRLVFEYLRDHADTDIASAHLLIAGRDVVLCAGDELIDVMRSRGQGVLNLSLDIGAVKSDLDAHPDVTPGRSFSELTPNTLITADAPQRIAL